MTKEESTYRHFRCCETSVFRVKRDALAEDSTLQGNRLKSALGNRKKRSVWRVEVSHRKGVSAGAMERRMDRPFDRRTFVAFERIAVQVRGDHVFSAQTSFVGTHARRDQDPFRLRLINADVTENTDHALHRKNARAGG